MSPSCTASRRNRATAALTALAVGLTLLTIPAASALDVSPDSLPAADIGFRDVLADGSVRPVRNDLTGALAGQVELAQSSTVAPTGNSAREMPTLVAERAALVLFTPTRPTSAVTVEARVGGTVVGTLPLAHPNEIPATDQVLQDGRGTVSYSLRAWSAELPWTWVKPGLSLTFVDASGTRGTVATVDVAAPTEIVLNNIQLGMLTTAPDSNGHRFLKDPAWGATDYFETIPVSKMTMAMYEKVELDQVIVGSGAIYTKDSPSPQDGGVYSGDMRENVGKAQVSTGINLATWGITSSAMNQNQPGLTNQRVIHHSAGLYKNGRQTHGLSGGNGMATLYDTVGNELSHELGHSYGLGHYPGMNWSATGDDVARNATHHLESGWGYIAHRGLMRSNLSTGAYVPSRGINGATFTESLVGRYNFNTDAMAGGWDASPVSDYTHHTGYSAKRIQGSLRTLVHDTSYPSGYRDWDASAGRWVDAKVKNPAFDRPRPAQVGVPVFTLLGGYNPAKPEQSLLYPAFRSNYGVTFDLPQADVRATSATRQCWVEVDFASAPTQHIALDGRDGVKQLNVNVASSAEPTGAQIACRQDGVTTDLGEPITIATDLAPLPAPVVVGQEAGYDALRTQELTRLDDTLRGLASSTAPVLSAADMIVLEGWRDDLSTLSTTARTVAEAILARADQSRTVAAYLAEHGPALSQGDVDRRTELLRYLNEHGLTDAEGKVLPDAGIVTVDNGKCLQLRDPDADPSTAPEAWVTSRAADCTGTDAERWFMDGVGSIRNLTRPDLCMTASSPVRMLPCSTRNSDQRWVLGSDGVIVRGSNAGSALDLNRQTNRPVLYGKTGTPNQVWKGLVRGDAPVLVTLDGAVLGSLVEARLDELVDTTAPTITVRTSTAPTSAGWYTRPTTVALTATDALDHAPTLRATVGGRAVTDPASFALPEGTTTVTAESVDRARNTGTFSVTYRVDTVAPVSTATVSGSTLTARATDATSGIDRIEYRLGGSGPWLTYRSPVVLSAGRSTVEVRAVDKAGNVESAVSRATGVAKATVTATRAATFRYGDKGAIRVAVRGADGPATGTVRVYWGTRDLGQATLNNGVATVRTHATRVTAGKRSLRVVYSGDAQHAPASGSTKVQVYKARTKISASTKKSSKAGTKKSVKVRVRATTGAKERGRVTLVLSKKGRPDYRKTFTVKHTTRTVTIPASRLRDRGTYRIKVTFHSSKNFVGKTTKKTIRVR